jgi:hypothetical protein
MNILSDRLDASNFHSDIPRASKDQLQQKSGSTLSPMGCSYLLWGVLH